MPDIAQRTQCQWTPREATLPPEAWCKQALKVVEYAQDQLSKNPAAQRWLSERGITPEAANKARLGWISSNLYFDRADWGLPDKQDADRITTKIFIPIGVAIPSTTGDAITRMRIRKFIGSPDNKYHILPSSCMAPMVLDCNTAKDVVVVVESELDGILLNSVAGDLVTVVALGSAQAKPDADTVKILNDAERILVALDTDRAGYNGWLWWRQNFNKAVRWPVIKGKDPGEAYKGGLDLRTWIMAGLINDDSP